MDESVDDLNIGKLVIKKTKKKHNSYKWMQKSMSGIIIGPNIGVNNTRSL